MSTVATPQVELRGLDDFAGTVIDGFDDVLGRLDELTGQRVALVGDLRRVARLVGRLAESAALLKVFQRDGVWVLPQIGGPTTPIVAALQSIVPAPIYRHVKTATAERNLRHQVSDGWVRRQLTPAAPPARDNLVYSNGYYRALRRDDVELVTWPIAGVVPAGIRTADGLEHHVDVIVTV